MSGRLWIEIVKGDDIFIAVDDLGRNLTFNNLAEDALWI
jgi:hypothetical protein